MNTKLVCLVVCFAVVALAAPALAGLNANAKVSVHVIPHASRTCTGGIIVADCTVPAHKDTVELFNVYCAGIGGIEGQNPCEPMDTEQTTWGEVKILFR